MSTLNDLIMNTDFQDVWKCLMRHYNIEDEKTIHNFERLYGELVGFTPSFNDKNIYIYIKAFQEDEDGEAHCVDKFDENDMAIYFDVSGRDDKGEGYSLVAASFDEWLGYYICERTLKKLSYPNIIAHCLREMTFFGFEQEWDEDIKIN
ncbi:DUF6557 family protein [Wukongibacter baidiensis]|uniref:DUF6557 family protein n=1 Tax=Wukongibacter baidiensis TaxID=1723361 RepID=UPI003D7FBE93